jgi:hypothetical protein
MMLVADLKLAPRTSYRCNAPAIGRMSGGITTGGSVRLYFSYAFATRWARGPSRRFAAVSVAGSAVGIGGHLANWH